ncbi:MAG: DUF192 domain-containing protein [Chloroflexota bacterium]
MRNQLRSRRGLLAALGLMVACSQPVRSQEGAGPAPDYAQPNPPSLDIQAEPPPAEGLPAPLAVFEHVSAVLEVARTDLERQKGLGGHAPLNETDGMLFVFDSPAFHSFWMKGMLFPLDLMWIENGVVVHIERDAPHHAPETPDLRLPIYAPAAPATYVLEVNAGFGARYGIGVGTPVELRGV